MVKKLKLKALVSISPKAFLAKAYNGDEAILPKSQVFEIKTLNDLDEDSSECFVASWVLNDKKLQHSHHDYWYNLKTGKAQLIGTIDTHVHVPEKVNYTDININDDLLR